ncbi:MAG: c-type cytochrome biogenesis protein CcmI [Gammaproteobacteria bacterium]|nr:MAG: c-type cytochrome biogenesis protein CcmI [Gammaproteobacteria bacterium]
MFWIILFILILAALLFVIPPLLRQTAVSSSHLDQRESNIKIYRQQLQELEKDLENKIIDQTQYEKSREELEQRLLEDIGDASEDDHQHVSNRNGRLWPAITALILIPAISVGIYWNIGSPDLITKERIQQKSLEVSESGTGNPHGSTTEQIAQMVTSLEKRMEQDPNDAEGWLMLARSYVFLQRYDDAVRAFEKSEALNPEDPRMLTDYADAVAMANGGTLNGLPLKLIRRALTLDPNNQKGLWLAGTAAYDSGDFKSAIKIWSRLYPLLEPGSQGAMTMQENLKETRELYLAAGGDKKDIPDLESMFHAQDADTNGKTLEGTVQIADALKDRISPNDTVFIFAKATSGPPMPVAILRTTADRLPMHFVLSDANSVMPARKLSQLKKVTLGARISKSGNAMPQSGDLQSERIRVNTGTTDINLTINQTIP